MMQAEKQSGMERWQQIARRIRVPLGFVTGAVYLFELWRMQPAPGPIVWSLVLVVPGVALRAYASGYVKKNRELTQTGPYAFTRNPLYLGSVWIAAGFAVALGSWAFALVVFFVFAAIYIPVIASEERFLRSVFSEFDGYCKRVPRLIPRLTPARPETAVSAASAGTGGFSLELYLRHREYNALVGAALIYLSLLFLRPACEAILNRVR